MPYTVQLPGFPGGITISDAQYAQYVAQGLLPPPLSATTPFSSAPAVDPLGKNVTTASRTSSLATPCDAYENAKRMGQNPAIVEALRVKCAAYQEAQAFASSPAAPPPMAAPMTYAEAPATDNKKWWIVGGVAAAALVGLGVYLKRK